MYLTLTIFIFLQDNVMHQLHRSLLQKTQERGHKY